MLASPKLRAAVLSCALAALAVGFTAAPALAKYPGGDVYCRDRAVFGNTLHFYPNSGLCGKYRRTSPCFSTYNVRPLVTGYPVTLYDSFGRPYVVYQTGYSTFLR